MEEISSAIFKTIAFLESIIEKFLLFLFKMLDLSNEKIFYFMNPFVSKLWEHIKENTLGFIMIVIIFIAISYSINQAFKKKYGNSIKDFFLSTIFLSSNGIFLYLGKIWLEYARKNNKVLWYPLIFNLFFLFAIIFFTLCIIIKIFKERKIRDIFYLFFMLSLFLIFYALTKVIIGIYIFTMIIAIIGLLDGGSNSSKGNQKKSYQQQVDDLESYHERERLKNIPSIRLKEDDYY